MALQTLPWAEFARRTVALYASPARSPGTGKKMEYVLRLAAGLGATRPEDLTTELAARFAAARSRAVAVATLRGELSYLKAAANYAVEEGWLPRAPRWRRVWPRPAAPTRPTAFPIEDVARVLAHLEAGAGSWTGHRLYALAELVACTGVRKMEALRLRVEDISPADRIFRVVSRPGNRLKTVASERVVPICPELAGVLGGWLPALAGVGGAAGGPAWAFPGVRGRGPWTGGPNGGRATDRLRAAAEEAGVHGLTFQSLRHTFATCARRRWGISGLQLRDILGHAAAETQEHYVHGEPDVSRMVAAVAAVSYGSK